MVSAAVLPKSKPAGQPLASKPMAMVEFPQLMFCAGDYLPKYLEGTIKVPTKEELLCFGGGQELPEEFSGAIFVDPVSCKGFYMPEAQTPFQIFKADQVLPSFNGAIDVYTPAGQVSVSGAETTPADMIGAILCLNGELCYLGDAPATLVPDELQVGGDKPGPDSEVEMWVDKGISKTKNADGVWVQTTTYGA